ncbi:MAG: hypothetical protein HY360_00695 [Verrucomicrobia bacterium]|nr:hypothetical protein [Verrucomicrobiota bacterium]
MTISFVPSGSEDLGSSRVRVYSLVRALARKGVRADIGPRLDSDIVVIQKGVAEQTLHYVAEVKRRGKSVIYDADDVGATLALFGGKDLIRRMCQAADLVTTDTAGHREQLMRDFQCRNVEVIPNPIDYDPSCPVETQVAEAQPLRVVWFGNAGNFPMIQPFVDMLTALPDARFVVIMNAFAKDLIYKTYPSVEFIPWARNDFLAHLRNCHLSCFFHDQSETARHKSNNKMIASIHWGVPAIVSNSAEYERTARECGVADAVFSDHRSLHETIERFRPAEARRRYLQIAQPIVWQRYAPDVVAEIFMNVLRKLLQSRSG